MENKFEPVITGILHSLGVRSNLKGYFYLYTAIIMTVEAPTEITAVTKTLYPNVAKEYGTTASCVERAMRHAISTACERADLGTISKYFGNTVKSGRGKPTNSEFISTVAEVIRAGGNI